MAFANNVATLLKDNSKNPTTPFLKRENFRNKNMKVILHAVQRIVSNSQKIISETSSIALGGLLEVVNVLRLSSYLI